MFENRNWGMATKRTFIDRASRFISSVPLVESQAVFNDVLRNEQCLRNAHISCLPLDLRIYILLILNNGNILNVCRNVVAYLHILGKYGLVRVLEDYTIGMKRVEKVKDACNCFIRMNLPSPLCFPLIILVECAPPAPAFTGTSKGRYIAAVIEDCVKINTLSDEVEKLASSLVPMRVSAHNGALVSKHRQNPFSGEEEHVSIELSGKRHKIWWVDNGQALISIPLSEPIIKN